MLNARHTIALLALVAAAATATEADGPGLAKAGSGHRHAPPPRPAAPVPDTVLDHSELEPEVRAELPDLELTMIRYDSNPDHRFVILNGRRVTEGLPAGQDLWVHEIRPKVVVMIYIDRYFLLRPR